MINPSILSYGLITPHVTVSSLGVVQRREPLDAIQREEVYSEPHRGFGKLALVDKIAFGASALALESSHKYDASTTGVLLSSSQGSLTRDTEYWHSVQEGFARPALFPATLPSSPIAEIAIVFGLKGANRVVLAPKNREFMLLQNASMMLTKEETLLVVSVNEKEQGYGAALLLGPPSTSNTYPQLQLTNGLLSQESIPSFLPYLIDALARKSTFSISGSSGSSITLKSIS